MNPGATPAQTAVRVLVVDDQRVVREGLQLLLGLLDGLDVVGTAADGLEAVSMVATHDPDVVLMDLGMPRMDGVEATRALAADHPDVPVVILTTYAEDDRILAALQAGARGFLTKDASASEIEAAIHGAAQGRAHLEPEVQLRLLEMVRSGAAFGVPARSAASPAPDGLTPREVEVVALVAAGLSNSEIAARLYVSTATVKTHINHIFAKTGLRDRAQLVGYAYRSGLADPPG